MDSLFNSPTPNTSPFTSDFDNTLNKNISSILSLLGSPTDDDTPEKKTINVLKDVVAYVDVRSASGTANMSRAIMKELVNLGATVVTKFTPEVTHVVFKEGKNSTKEKAIKKGISLVSVLWVESCKETSSRVAETLYPITSEQKTTPLLARLKKARSMQPKDFDQELARSAERNEKRRKRMKTSTECNLEQLSASPLTLSTHKNKNFFVEETQPRSPNELYFSPAAVPDTPQSTTKHACHSAIRPVQKNELSSVPSDYTSPLAARIGADIIQKRLFEPTDESICTCEMTPEKILPCNPLGVGPHPCSSEKHRHISCSHTDLHGDDNSAPLVSTPSTPVTDTCPQHSPLLQIKKFGLYTSPSSDQVNKNVKSDDDTYYDDEDPIPPQLLKSKSTSRKRKLMSNIEHFKPTLLAPTKATNAAQEKKGILGTPKEIRKTAKPRKSLKRTESFGITSTENKSSCLTAKDNVKNSDNAKNTVSFLEKSTTVQSKTNASKYSRRKSVHVMLPVPETNSSPQSSREIVIPETEKKTVPSKSIRRKSMHCASLSPLENHLDSCTAESKKKNSGTDIEGESGTNAKRRKSMRHGNLQETLVSVNEKSSVSTESKKTRRKSSGSYLEKNDNLSRDIDIPEKNPSVKSVANKRRSMRLAANYDSEEKQVEDTSRVEVSGMFDSIAYPSLSSLTRNRRSIDDFSLKNNTLSKSKNISLSKCNNKALAVSVSRASINSTGSSRKSSVSIKTKDTCRSSTSSSGNSKPPKHWKKVLLPDNSGKEPQHSIVMTSLHTAEQDLVSSIVKKLGNFSVVTHVEEKTTHVILGDRRRTINVLRGIARGCWLLSLEWVFKSLEAGRWLPEEPYERQENFPAAKVSRLQRQTTNSSFKADLFKKAGPIFIAVNTRPPKQELIHLVKICGGQVEDTKRKAAVCVGQGSSPSSSCKTVDEQWILDSITSYTCLPVEQYALVASVRHRRPSDEY